MATRLMKGFSLFEIYSIAFRVCSCPRLPAPPAYTVPQIQPATHGASRWMVFPMNFLFNSTLSPFFVTSVISASGASDSGSDSQENTNGVINLGKKM